MLKPQDIVILLKIFSMITLSKKDTPDLLSQNKLALHLCMSVSEVNAGLNRLIQAGLLGEKESTERNHRVPKTFLPIKSACEECLIFGVKYFFPVELGTYTVGIPTSYAAPIFEKLLMIGNDPIPVWGYAEGTHRGLALTPLYSSVPKSVTEYPDPMFYDLLTLVDAIRTGRVRERQIAIQLLKDKIHAS